MISTDQNRNIFYKYLKTQRVTYSRAKIIRFTKYSVTILIAVLAPMIFIYFPNKINTFGIIGAIWTLIAFLIGYIEKWHVKRAATIQEIFDTELYQIDWNEISFGEKQVPHEYINSLTENFTSLDLEYEFKNWYEGINGIEKPTSVLLCQRQNIVWDFKLRDVYAYIVISLLILNFGVGLFVFSYSGETLLNYLIGLMIPSLSANILGIEEAIGHLSISKRKKDLSNKLVTLINQNGIIENTDLRDIQNVIFEERLKAPLIPDFIFKILKNKYSNNSIASIQDILELNN